MLASVPKRGLFAVNLVIGSISSLEKIKNLAVPQNLLYLAWFIRPGITMRDETQVAAFGGERSPVEFDCGMRRSLFKVRVDAVSSYHIHVFIPTARWKKALEQKASDWYIFLAFRIP